LQFLNEIGLDPTSAGYLAEEMHLSKSQQKEKAIESKLAAMFDLQ